MMIWLMCVGFSLLSFSLFFYWNSTTTLLGLRGDHLYSSKFEQMESEIVFFYKENWDFITDSFSHLKNLMKERIKLWIFENWVVATRWHQTSIYLNITFHNWAYKCVVCACVCVLRIYNYVDVYPSIGIIPVCLSV